MTNISLFTAQLKFLLEQHTADEWPGRVCELLSAYTLADVCLTGGNNEIIAQVIYEDRIMLPEEEVKRISFPIKEADSIIGALTVSRPETVFDKNEQHATHMVSCVCTIILRLIRERADAEHARHANAVKAALNNLSFSELEAVINVFIELKNSEGLLVTGKVADALGITRSVVVNGLRKLTAAGMLETRSLGMKGTYIKVLNPLFPEELKKLERV